MHTGGLEEIRRERGAVEEIDPSCSVRETGTRRRSRRRDLKKTKRDHKRQWSERLQVEDLQEGAEKARDTTRTNTRESVNTFGPASLVQAVRDDRIERERPESLINEREGD